MTQIMRLRLVVSKWYFGTLMSLLFHSCTSFPPVENYQALRETDSTGTAYFNRFLQLSCTKAEFESDFNATQKHQCEPYSIVPIKKLLPLVSKNTESITYQGADKKYHYFILWIKITRGENEVFDYAVKRRDCILKKELTESDERQLEPRLEVHSDIMLNIGGKCVVQTSREGQPAP